MTNWMMPGIYHSITVAPANAAQRVERVYDNGATTYYYQLKGASKPAPALCDLARD